MWYNIYDYYQSVDYYDYYDYYQSVASATIATNQFSPCWSYLSVGLGLGCKFICILISTHPQPHQKDSS